MTDSGTLAGDYDQRASAITRIIEVTPRILSDGAKHPNAFEARLAGREAVLCVSDTPLLDSARALLKAGMAQPHDLLEMRHAGSKHYSVRGRVGRLAGLTIKETGFGPKISKYKPFHGVPVSPRIDET